MITQTLYLKEFEHTINEMLEITTRKNHDYSTTESNWDAYKNFKMVEELGITSVEKWILVRMTDKLTRISNLLDKEWLVSDEKIEDTLLDLANYAIILKIYLTYHEPQDTTSEVKMNMN